MHLKTRNVNTAFRELVETFDIKWNHGRSAPIVSRPYKNPNGEGFTLRINEPVTITYTHPRERVLFNTARDANPFLHLYEALWMLAGRNDVKPLQYYSKQYTYTDDGVTVNGAYGHRWRTALLRNVDTTTCMSTHAYDQLDVIVSHLQRNPNSRRAVLAMWNVEDDLLKVDTSKDVCCNLNCMFSIREELVWGAKGEGDRTDKVLDMTVTNRSNDLVWGLLGTNFVHFSLLQEYMAARLGVQVGVYHHFTNNLHAYDWNFKPDEWLKFYSNMKGNHEYDGYTAEGGIELNSLVPFVKDPTVFEEELSEIVQKYTGYEPDFIHGKSVWREPFLHNVVRPMMTAFKCYKQKSMYSALKCAAEIKADDWRMACTQWLLRRDKGAGIRTQDDKV